MVEAERWKRYCVKHRHAGECGAQHAGSNTPASKDGAVAPASPQSSMENVNQSRDSQSRDMPGRCLASSCWELMKVGEEFSGSSLQDAAG